MSMRSLEGDRVAASESNVFLVCRAGKALCALPVEHVVETMRPLAIESLPDAPACVAGVAIVRGSALPIVEISRLLGEAGRSPDRIVVVRAGGREVGLAADAVVGLRKLPRSGTELPPLLAGMAHEVVEGVGALDGDLLFVLKSMSLVSDEVFRAAGVETAAA